jgi:phosphate transport system permease protein
MSPAILLLLAFGLGLVGWLAARSRAWAFRRQARAIAPAFAAQLPRLVRGAVDRGAGAGLALIWNAVSPALITAHVLADPAAAALPGFGFERESMLAQARAVAEGKAYGVFMPEAEGLIAPYRVALTRYESIGLVVTILVALAGGAFAFLRLKPDFTARTRVERAVMGLLLIASLVAILTTAGIIVSLVFETVRFFGMVSPIDFLFGTHWAPDPMSTGTPTAASSARFRCSGARSISARSLPCWWPSRLA